MDGSLVSVIVPVYNSEKYLPACIRSCTEQNYKNIEILLVDDGSTDASLAVCEKFAASDLRIKVIHQENAGVSAARNTGLRHATGAYIFFLDSDDEIYPHTIELLLTDMQQYHGDIVSGGYSKVEMSGWECSRYNDGTIKVYEGDLALILSLKYDRLTSCVWGKLFSRKILDHVFFVEGRSINEDGYFIFQCYAKRPRLVQHNRSIYKYYIRASSATRGAFSEKYFDMLFFSDLKMAYIKEKKPHLTELAKDMEVSTHLFLLDALCRDTESRYKNAAKASVRFVRKRFLKYRSINRHERKMAFIVAVGLYPLYRKIWITRYYKRKSLHSHER